MSAAPDAEGLSAESMSTASDAELPSDGGRSTASDTEPPSDGPGSAASDAEPPSAGPLGVRRIASLVAGVALFAVAIRYAVVRSGDVRPAVWVRWWVTAAVIHDVLVAPLAIAAGSVVVRFAPRVAKAPVQAGLILSAVLVAVSWPALRGYGRIPSNPTYLPRDYDTGLAVSLLVVWVACGAWAAARLVGGRRVDRSR